MAHDNPNIAISLTSLAGFYKTQGMYEQAELFFQRALYIWEQTLMLEHPEGIEVLNVLTDLYLLQDKYEQAELLLLNALQIRERVLSIDHPVMVILQQKMDKIHQHGVLKSEVD